MTSEVLSEGRVKNIGMEAVRKRFEKKYVPLNLIKRIKTASVIYDLNENARKKIKEITREFVAIKGVSDLI